MPRQFGKVDVSATWLPCPRCPHRHPATAPCPPTGIPLVLALCRDCRPEKDLYCRTHRDRHAPALHAVPAAPVDVQQLAVGEREEG